MPIQQSASVPPLTPTPLPEAERGKLNIRAWLSLYLVVAVWLAFTKLFTLHTADSLIYSLGSLDHWTPFFWEQDRVGMLVPLVTMPLRHPLANLLLQTVLMTFCGLSLPLLLARLLNPTTAGAIATVVSNVLFIALAPALLHENQFIVCMYPVGLCLGVSALIVLNRDDDSLSFRRASWLHVVISLVLMTLGMWTYLGIVVILLPLACLRFLTTRRFSGILVTLVSFAVGFALMKFVNNLPPYDVPTSNESLPWREWPAAWAMLLFRIREQPGGNDWLFSVVIVVGIGLLAVVVRRPRRRDMIAIAILLIVAGVEVGFCGTRKWISHNIHHPRYIIFAITAVPLAAAMLLTSVSCRCRMRSCWLCGLALIGLFGTGSWRYGLPAITQPRQISQHQFCQYSSAVRNSDCPVMGAKYWDLWTTYFWLRLEAYESGGTAPIPIGWRTWEYRHDWSDLAKSGPFRVAVPKGAYDELNLESVRRGLDPLKKVGETETLEIYETRPFKR
ncbi:hypothetical protein BH11PLA2_BH11PLA2_50150 [soil metagenome]